MASKILENIVSFYRKYNLKVNENSFNPTPKLKSSPVPILFIPFNENAYIEYETLALSMLNILNNFRLQTIHEKDFVHRDFHSGNILIKNNLCKIDQYLIENLGLSRPSNDIPQDSNIYVVIPYIVPKYLKASIF
ncbi:hypothetical protein GLOIN_2v1774291 [Rhizophagus irregularis DAOM 181602=DAOM 197198]|uniref:Protein kinase domain-containing protein n=1 Tax=Rhizophagus irregularis (strain DAOM 181602 / DAOM 197198 / MUCL 43194) TaxID=747089 RepID=A0A2P4Q2R6_RHIID|nr:hypothetical protein GLOIN_2v1774291 [Rhizophagus irregularis DAOM 181602=DAOM 197198]POG71906.1 hypothetical protein GLOIN_2v1774291 [Rhizophagus irregularis DAOM 181602=DAOM 197198]|eukprot:XP_025178772.1 hypothetical protein GLOIN_2v1774291 [Rhizophagus irregularis DAOM 181602=DAOM 197198]